MVSRSAVDPARDTVGLYYWSPSYSQIYTELKKLESLGLVTSRVDRDEGTHSRRLDKITPTGMAAVTDRTNNAPVDPPVLKHSVLLRVTFTRPRRELRCSRTPVPARSSHPRPGTSFRTRWRRYSRSRRDPQ